MQDDYNLQVNVKYGPKDDRGVPVNLLNVRGHTAQDILDQVRDLASKQDAINEAVYAFATGENVGTFTHTQPVSQQQQQQTTQNAPSCAHGLRKYVSGQKNGKAWAGWMCPQPKDRNPCAPAWVD